MNITTIKSQENNYI